jgi:hypothetical protein
LDANNGEADVTLLPRFAFCGLAYGGFSPACLCDPKFFSLESEPFYLPLRFKIANAV